MASRPILSPYSVITNGDMSTTLTSLPTIIQNLSMLSYEISWSGTAPVGVISLQVSNSYSQNADGSVRNAGNWSDAPLSNPPDISGNTGVGFVDVIATGAFAARLVYTPTSGVGSMNIIVSGKVS